MAILEGPYLSQRALSDIFSLIKLQKLEPGILEYLEVVLEASHSQTGNEEHFPAAFLLQLGREATRAEFIQSREQQLPPNLTLLVIISTSVTEDHGQELNAVFHDLD
jgi:hypothetical protein